MGNQYTSFGSATPNVVPREGGQALPFWCIRKFMGGKCAFLAACHLTWVGAAADYHYSGVFQTKKPLS